MQRSQSEAKTIRPRDPVQRPALTPVERRSVGALAAIYASRMLGMFLMLPVLALYAQGLPDYTPEMLGVAMGAYGLTQAILQIPFGRWSDRYGRKPLIALGLLCYAAGSVIGMYADSVLLLAVARGVQGAGAVSAAVTALLADLTRSEVRTRSMAVIGISIGLSFVVALILAPVLDVAVGVPGIFAIMLGMSLFGLALLFLAVPVEPGRTGGAEGRELSQMLEILGRPQLRPLYFGMFALHAIMTATFLSVPQVLEQTLGIARSSHWAVYLGVFMASLAGTIPLVLRTERTSTRGAGLLVLSVALTGVAQAVLGFEHADFWVVMGALVLFFAVFNFLEARLPALLTLTAPASDRGAALGVFATSQFLGAFAGGAVGGLLLGRFGVSGVFFGSATLAFGWAVLAVRSTRAAPQAVSG